MVRWSVPLPKAVEIQPIYTELLPHRVGYWRMSSFRPAKDWEALRNQLRLWKRSSVIGLVLDVRDFADINNFEGAAAAASLFVEPGTTLFSVQGLQIPQRVYKADGDKANAPQPIIVLTNPRTTGAAEAFAAALQESAGAIVVGRSTAGRSGLWEEIPLSTGRYLRMVVGRTTSGLID